MVELFQGIVFIYFHPRLKKALSVILQVILDMVTRVRLNTLTLIYSIITMLVIGALYIVLSTSIGLHYTVACLKYCLSGHLEITNLRGRLLGPIKAERLEYQDAQYLIKLHHIEIDWNKSALLKRQFSIQKLGIQNLIVRAKPIKPVKQNKPFHIPSFLKRIRLHEAQVVNCVFKIDDFQFQGQGTLGIHSDFYWALQYKHAFIPFKKNHILKLEGTLKGDWLKEPQFELKGASKKTSLQIAPFSKDSLKASIIKVPHLQIKSQFKDSKWLTQLKFIHQNKIQASIDCTITSLQYWFQTLPTSKENVQCDLEFLIKDWLILKNIAFLKENLLLTDVTGPLRIKCHLEDTKGVLQQWIQSPKYLLEKDPQAMIREVEKLRPVLSLLWQKPVVPNAGIALDEYSMTADLKDKQIRWQAYLIAASQLADSLGKWECIGTTQCLFEPLPLGVSWWNYTNLKHDFILKGTAIPWCANTNYAFWAAPNLHILANRHQAALKGMIEIPKAKFKFQYTDSNQTLDKDVQFTDRPTVSAQLFPLAVDVGIHLGKAVSFEYEGAKARLEGAVHLQKRYDADSLSAKGEIRFAEGYYFVGDQKLLITPDSKFIFKNSWRAPQMDITASQSVQVHPRGHFFLKLAQTLHLPQKMSKLLSNTGFEKSIKTKFGLHLGGSTENPSLRLLTSPPEWISQPREDISEMLTGQPIDCLSIASVPILLNAAVQFSIGYSGYQTLLNRLNKRLDLYFEVKADQALEQAHLLLSKALTPKLSIAGQFGLKDYRAQFHYLLNKNMMVEGKISHLLGTGLDLVYQKEY